MTTVRKKSGVAFWATVVVVVALVGYPLSVGPTAWIYGRLGHWDVDPLNLTVYAPVRWVEQRVPISVALEFAEYVDWCGKNGCMARGRDGE